MLQDKYLALKRAYLSGRAIRLLCSFTTDATSQLYIPWHDSHSLGMDCAQVCIFHQPNQIRLGSFLKSHNSTRLETQIRLEILSYFTNQTLEGQFAQQQLRRLLVTSDFTEGHSSRPISVWLLHYTSGW